MAARERLICASAALVESGDGVRFDIVRHGVAAPAFAVRFDGEVRAYVNRCAHIPMELDWRPGRFFDAEGLLLVCSTHGAMYAPDTGVCVGGPCSGALERLAVVERDGNVYVKG